MCERSRDFKGIITRPEIRPGKREREEKRKVVHELGWEGNPVAQLVMVFRGENRIIIWRLAIADQASTTFPGS